VDIEHYCRSLFRSTGYRLREVDGIGPVRANRIVVAWAERKAVRKIMAVLMRRSCNPTSDFVKELDGNTRQDCWASINS
jgi:hypothetical protein